MTWEDESPWFLPPGLEAGAREVPSPLLVEDIVERLKEARRQHLAHLPVAEIVEVIDRVVATWLTPDSPWMETACRRIAANTPYSRAMVRTGLGRLLEGCRKASLLALLERGLGDPSALDGFRPGRAVGGLHRACGPGLTTHIFSGNVPGLPAVSLMQALLVKSASLGKPASEEMIFPALFARSVAALEPGVGATLAILPWPGGDEVVEQAAFAASDAVIAYGSDAATESIRARLPSTVRFVGHGHKISFAVIGRESLNPEEADRLADRLAHDVSLFDQQGCVSAHLAYVERGGAMTPDAFAERLAAAMARFEQGMPRGHVTMEEAAAIRQARTQAELRELRDEPVRLFVSPGGTAWTVIYEDDPAFVPSCLNRVVRVKALSDVADLPSLLPTFSRHLQTVGMALAPTRREHLAERLASLGVCRICPIGEMPHPPLAWHHDGGFSLLPLLRWTTIEG